LTPRPPRPIHSHRRTDSNQQEFIMRVALAVLFLLAAMPAGAQQPAGARQPAPLAIAGDIGVAIPLGEFADDGAGAGWSAGATGTLRIAGPLGVFASLERTSFRVTPTRVGITADRWTDTGVAAGLRFNGAVAAGARLWPWAQVGLGLHFTDAPLGGPEFSAVDTDGIRTIEGGAGVDIVLFSQRLFLRPTGRYRSYRFDLGSPAGTTRSRARYAVLAVGVVMPLGARREDGR
jgi:hypothetical protein